MSDLDRVSARVDPGAAPTDVVGALCRLFESDDDNGGTECSIAKCHAKATDTTVWRGQLLHVCSRHATNNAEEQ